LLLSNNILKPDALLTNRNPALGEAPPTDLRQGLWPRSARWPAAAGLSSALTMVLFMRTVFPDRTVFFPHINQPEQYFDLFFSTAEQAHSLLSSSKSPH